MLTKDELESLRNLLEEALESPIAEVTVPGARKGTKADTALAHALSAVTYYIETVSDTEDAYAALADEMNDEEWDAEEMACCFDPGYIERARKYAEANQLSWPPQPGDYDRYYDRKVNGGK